MALLTAKQAVDYLLGKVQEDQPSRRRLFSVTKLKVLRRAGGGPRFNKRFGIVVYDSADLDKWFDEGWQRSTADVPGHRTRHRVRGSHLEHDD